MTPHPSTDVSEKAAVERKLHAYEKYIRHESKFPTSLQFYWSYYIGNSRIVLDSFGCWLSKYRISRVLVVKIYCGYCGNVA